MNLFGVMRLPASVIFGNGQRAALGTLVASLGQRALVCTDARLGADSQFIAMVADLRANGVDTHVYDRTQVDLPVESILDCVRAGAAHRPDVVLGIGGGSCMDMAKLTSLLLRHGGDLADYYGEFKVPGPVLPLVAVPTTAGTGSEVTPVAVLSDTARATKIGISSPWLIPNAAICDPELTLSCPRSLTAYSGADALTHAIEAFTARRRTPDAQLALKQVFVGKNVLSDHFALLAITSIWGHLQRACDEGGDLEAREHLMLGALAAGCAFSTAGTAAAHALQYPVGNLTHTPHGAGVATLLPYVMAFNRPACIPAFAQIARVLGLGLHTGADEASLSFALVDAVAALFGAIGIPATLKDLGLPADSVTSTAESALGAQRLVNNNPRELNLGAMAAIAQAAYDGDRGVLDRPPLFPY
jgi:alcohol dehydrogenase class IV